MTLQRGVKQGCPKFPCLFNVFINDILESGGMIGVDLASLLERIDGVMFVDDLALLVDNLEELQASPSRTSD